MVHGPENAIFMLTGISQKGIYTLIWSLDTFNCHQETPSHRLALVAMRLIVVVLQDCVFAFLKSCCLPVWLPINLSLGAN